MQAWIPVVSSSLYFWKSVFSFRADNILKSDGDFISNWKFPDCVHFFGAWARQAVIETIAVVYELTKRTQEELFADWAQYHKAFFVPNQEPASAWIFRNSSVRVGSQGLFRPYLKTFVLPFLPTRLTAPGSPRMSFQSNHDQGYRAFPQLFAICTSSITHLVCLLKFCITFVFHFSWVLKPCQEK